ncbi:MAG: hypothetical protein Q6373_003960 [Candidatus Sigynarchaeota archaeon]
MSEDIKAFKELAKASPEQLKVKDIQAMQKHILALVTDLGDKGEKKLDILGEFLVKLHSADKDVFFKTIAPLFDFVRNNPKVDIFSPMLARKAFTTRDLTAVFQRAFNTGALSIFDLETFLPKAATKTKQALLLGRMLKASSEGVMQDTVCDQLVKLVLPADMPSLDPASMMDMGFIERMMQSIGLLGLLHKQKFPVAPVINRIGEQQGPQVAMFVLLMLGQAFVDEDGIQAILRDMDNEVFANMFNNARKMMGNMMQGMAEKGGMPGMPLSPGGTLPGFRLPKVPGRSLLARILAKIMGFFDRFRRS